MKNRNFVVYVSSYLLALNRERSARGGERAHDQKYCTMIVADAKNPLRMFYAEMVHFPAGGEMVSHERPFSGICGQEVVVSMQADELMVQVPGFSESLRLTDPGQIDTMNLRRSGGDWPFVSRPPFTNPPRAAA